MFRKPRPKYSTVQVPMTTLKRWLMYDIGVPHKDRLARTLGMVPVSDEGEMFENLASDRRLARVIPIAPVLEKYSDLVATIYASALADDDLDPQIQERCAAMSRAALFGFVAAFLDLGLIKANYPGGRDE